MVGTCRKRARFPEASTAPACDTDLDGDTYLQRLKREQIRADITGANPLSGVENDILDNADSIGVDTYHSSDGDGLSDGSGVCPEHDPDNVAFGNVSENEVAGEAPP